MRANRYWFADAYNPSKTRLPRWRGFVIRALTTAALPV